MSQSSSEGGVLERAARTIQALQQRPPETRVMRLIADALDDIYRIGLVYGTDPGQPASLAAFVADSIPVWEGALVFLLDYPDDLALTFEGIWEGDEWQQFCRRRSGLQFFFDLYRPTALGETVELVEAETGGLDARMRDRGSRDGFLDAAAIDPAIPRSHWWWWEPTQ